MLKTIEIHIEGIHSLNDKNLIETEVDVLKGIKDISVNEANGETRVEFDNTIIFQDKIFEAIQKLGYVIRGKSAVSVKGTGQEHIYFVQGMHCASCEILIEKKLLSLPSIEAVEASTNKSQVFIEYTGEKPSVEKLNKIFQEDDYIFSDQSIEAKRSKVKNFFTITGAALLFIIGFLILKKSGLSGLVNINSSSSLPAFFVFGILAGVSSCAALVGGLVLSMSKQWLEAYSEKDSFFIKLRPHLMFNIGRITSYTILGAVLGAVGSKLQLSLKFTSVLVLVVSLMMFVLALQMLGVKALRRFQFTMPKFITRYAADEKNFQGRYMPFLMGAFTFFLPCGFTITAQSIALISGNPVQGGLIMLFFALGTLPMLLTIGLSSVKFFQKPGRSEKFLKVAGILVLFFAFYNINSQMNVLGFFSLSDVKATSIQSTSTSSSDSGLPPLVNGKQVIKMDASSSGYKPNYFKVKSGVPVRWEITDTGTSGCTNAVISRGLFDGQINLTPGQVSIKEFTPAKSGRYKFSCWMGMVSGMIEVVDQDANSQPPVSGPATDNNQIIPSGARGCGCGGNGTNYGSPQ